MKHIVSISGGSASAVAADRVIERYGSDSTTLWFADTLYEDEDLYRFLIDLENRWDKKDCPVYRWQNPTPSSGRQETDSE